VRRGAHKRRADLQAFVAHVLIPASPHAAFLLLIVEGARSYTSPSTRQWRAQRPPIVLVPLPSYAPHLNLAAQSWRWMRTAVTPNPFFATVAALITAAASFFATVADHPEAVLRRIGRAFPSLVDQYLASILCVTIRPRSRSPA
jgi:hypothetical protein